MSAYDFATSDLKSIRECMRLDTPSMAKILNLPLATYRSYEYGHRPTPATVMTDAHTAMKQDREWLQDFRARLDGDLARLYPHGIMSEVEAEAEI